MVFVPERQHDSSQARSAWNHEGNSPVPLSQSPSPNPPRRRPSSSAVDGGGCSDGRGFEWIRQIGERFAWTGQSKNSRQRRRDRFGDDAKHIQALCAWLRSACPSGTKAIPPSKRQCVNRTNARSQWLMKSRDKRRPRSRRYLPKESIEIEHATGGADERSDEKENRPGRTFLLGE